MKTDTFKSNGIIIERRESREGPSPYFVIHHKNTSRITIDVSSIKRQLKLGRGTETLQQLNAWLESFEPKTVALKVKSTSGHTADVA